MEMGSVVKVKEWENETFANDNDNYFFKSNIQLLPHFRHEVLSTCQKYIIIGCQESLLLSGHQKLKQLYVCPSVSTEH